MCQRFARDGQSMNSQALALDIVDPLTKGKGWIEHMLKAIYMATRWLESVPLRSVTARALSLKDRIAPPDCD